MTSIASASVDEIEVPEGHTMLCVLDQTGDSRVIFDPNDPDEVSAAKAQFEDLKGKGFVAYQVKKDGEPGEVMRKFDPKAGKIIMAKATVGG